ncbi:MAG: GNAT family N-acetyltransferase [Oscillibacter sp.]|nr:GNAT family N-acetyltransferase [Oscillibacter sp.]
MNNKLSFTLRPWRPEDAAAIVPYADDPLVAENLRDVFPNPYRLQDAEAYVRCCVEQEGQGQLCRAIVIDGSPCGSIGLFRGTDVYQKNAELGYWLGRPYWGRGVITGAVKAICREGFAAWDIARIYAEPYDRNLGSRRVLEKAGFTLEGTLRSSVWKQGQLLDSRIYSLLREECVP